MLAAVVVEMVMEEHHIQLHQVVLGVAALEELQLGEQRDLLTQAVAQADQIMALLVEELTVAQALYLFQSQQLTIHPQQQAAQL
jgi:hypothetical protein